MEGYVMETVITFTPAQAAAAFLWLCGAITAAGGAIAVLIKWRDTRAAPDQEQNARITTLEGRMDVVEKYLTNDDNRIKEMERGSRVTQKAILALLKHALDGNEIDGLKQATSELNEYLISK